MAQFGAGIPRPLKIDTEGAKHHVLRGARVLVETREVLFSIAELHAFSLQHLPVSQTRCGNP
jgi:hypothetical protein